MDINTQNNDNWRNGCIFLQNLLDEIQEMKNYFSSLAYTDQLLNLKNDIRFERDILETFPKPSLIVFDILSLKKINESYGSDIGDNLLLAVRDWIIGLNISDVELYRIDNDEFCLSVRTISADELLRIASRLSDRFKDPWILYNTNNSKMQVYCDISVAAIHSKFVPSNEPPINLVERTLRVAKINKTIDVYNVKKA